MLRVALVTGNYNYAIDGVALTCNRQVGYLERLGVPVKVFAPTKPRPLFPHAGELVSVPSVPLPTTPYRLALGLPPLVRKELAAFRPTLVHLCTPDLLGFAALRWARLRRIPVVATYHTHFAAYLKYYHVGLLGTAGLAVDAATSTAVVPRSMSRPRRWPMSSAAHGVEANYVEAPFGVDLRQFSPARRSLDWRRSLGIGDDEVVVAFVGRLVWEKGLGVFADALNVLQAEGLRFQVLVVGDGPAREGLQKKLPYAIFTGYLSANALATAYASADLFLNPSASETFGCVTLEALASGLAVVAADAPGSRDIIRAGRDGILCPPEDRRAFAGVVRRLIENPAERRELGAAGILRAAHYNWETVLAEALRRYQGLVARPEAR